MKNKSHMSMLNNNSPNIEPRRIPDRISCHELYVSDILVICLRDVRCKPYNLIVKAMCVQFCNQ